MTGEGEIEKIPSSIYEELGRILVICSEIDSQFARLIAALTLDKELSKVISSFANKPMGLRKKEVLALIQEAKKTKRGEFIFGNLDLSRLEKFIVLRNKTIHSAYNQHEGKTYRQKLKGFAANDWSYIKEEVTEASLRDFRSLISKVWSDLIGLQVLSTINSEILVEELIKYVESDGRICPKPEAWHRLWELLPGKEQMNDGGWNPPLPLILAAASQVSDTMKRKRLIEHIKYAATNGVPKVVDEFIRNLKPSDWIYSNEPDLP